MYKYRSIIENPEKLRSMTGLTADEFHALVPIFHAAFEAYMKRRTIDGHVRYCRRYVSYANSPLPTTEDKLLFILTYLKQNPTQVMHGHLFQMSQSNVSKWVHLLHGALNYALSQQNLLPARTADDLVRRLQEEPSCEEPSCEEPSHEEPSCEEPSHEEPSHEEPSHEEPSHATKAPPFLSMTA
jgi:hypothetical protein